MKRRSSAVGKPAKPRGPKRSTPKRGNAPKATRNHGVSVAGREKVVARLTHERDEALLRETANSEILRLISKSPDLELVFRTILEAPTGICDAKFGRYSASIARCSTLPQTWVARRSLPNLKGGADPFQPIPGSHLERVMRIKRVSHTADYAAEGVASPPDP
jgi:hypothetical protein